MIRIPGFKVKEISPMNQTNLNILYEDSHIIVCVKPHGIATQSKQIGAPDMVNLIKKHIFLNNPDNGEPYLAVIHRLDQPVKGILVFAKTPFAAKELNKQLTSHGFGKYYLALVEGELPAEEGTLENYLVKDARTNLSRVCDKNTKDAKLARLHYRILQKGQGNFHLGRCKSQKTTSQIEIKLDTGRHHQIRVQFAHIGCPLVGDTKYNKSLNGQKGWQEIALCAYKLDFKHPKTGKPMQFEISDI